MKRRVLGGTIDLSIGGMRLADLARATIADTPAWTPDADVRAAARPVATLAPGREAECLATLRP